MKTIDIFYKSYHKDFKLLKYSLETIKMNVTGYTNIIILIPQQEKHLFDTRDLPERTLIHYVEEFGNGYLFQQLCKITAHNYSNSEFILFADSDCLFDHKIDLQEFIKDEKPEILYTDWSKVGDAICWKECTEKFLGEPVPYEFMRRNCLIYHRTTFLSIELFTPNITKAVMSGGRFSEFNAIGAFCYKYEREKYNFVNTDEWEYTEPKAIQLWSLANKNGDGTHKQEYQRSLDTINKIFGLNLTEI